ncbi:endonuclease-reverse transcriptase [Plakobranchus ocellatus]|uniref:Endonuclease-reverse transcriptase n=1 Tax=Plakobranchus ocellatus TaxID=259542 RepID=A0AAV3YQQ4_9GAST|nr:endonuclease-reverse transcriptase [Plakobranchus ocellatus]
MGDFNAKVGEGASKRQGLGPYGLGVRNERGETLLNFCEANDMMILNTWYQQHPRRRYTWISPGDRCRNQIDYMLVQKTWHSSFIKCKTKPGADCDTDHILVVAKMKLKSYRKKSDNKR